jgi:hypothetical protein
MYAFCLFEGDGEFITDPFFGPELAPLKDKELPTPKKPLSVPFGITISTTLCAVDDGVGDLIPGVGDLIPGVGFLIPGVGDLIPGVGDLNPGVGEGLLFDNIGFIPEEPKLLITTGFLERFGSEFNVIAGFFLFMFGGR